MNKINPNSITPNLKATEQRRFFLKSAAVATLTPWSTLKTLSAQEAEVKTQEKKYEGPNAKDFYPTGEARTEWREWNQRASEMLNNAEFFKGLEMQKLKDGSSVVKLSLKNINAMKDKLSYDEKSPVKYAFARGIKGDRSSYTLFFVRENDPNGPLVRVRPIPLKDKEGEKAFNIYEPDFSAATVTKKDGVVSLNYDIVNADEVPLAYEPHDLYKEGIFVPKPEVMKLEENFSTKFKESSSKIFRDLPVQTIAVAGKPDAIKELYPASDRNYDKDGKERKHPLWDLDATFVRRPRKIEKREDGMMAYVQEPLLGEKGKKYSTDPKAKGARLIGGKIHKSGALIPERTGKVRHNRQVLNHKISDPELLKTDKQVESFYLEF